MRDARDPRNLGTPMTVSYEYADSVNPNPSAVIDADGAQTLYDWDERGLLTRALTQRVYPQPSSTMLTVISSS